MKKIKYLIIPLLVIILLVIIYFIAWRKEDALVVYCAHDSVYSEKILKQFEKETGINVLPRFDTESTKSLGLIELLMREKDQPRCDVFWNNEILGTIDLKNQGLFQPYKGAGYQRIPDRYKDPNGYWTGFAARLRVYIINNEKMSVSEKEINALLKSDNLSKFAIAKPLYGTTLTHYCCLWAELGEQKLKELHQQRIKKGIQIVNGNSTVKNIVSSGICDAGWTDTDDFFVAKIAGKPVEMLPVKLDESQCTICIPNTVAIINGTKREEKAQKLVDYLLSEKCEVALANSSSKQIPLGKVDESLIPKEISKMKKWAGNGYPLTDKLSEIRTKCVKWLKKFY